MQSTAVITINNACISFTIIAVYCFFFIFYIISFTTVGENSLATFDCIPTVVLGKSLQFTREGNDRDVSRVCGYVIHVCKYLLQVCMKTTKTECILYYIIYVINDDKLSIVRLVLGSDARSGCAFAWSSGGDGVVVITVGCSDERALTKYYNKYKNNSY